jgi:hypothetical protein
MELTLHEKRENIRTIDSFEIFKNDVVVRRNKDVVLPENRPTRSEIGHFSARARKRLAFVAANTDAEFVTMITLTYPREFETDGKEVKRHLNLFLKRFARRYEHEYLWFLEFQIRGAPHYHILSTRLDMAIDKYWLSSAWYEIVGSQDVKHLLAGTRVERLRKTGARYAVKYAYKMRQKSVPTEYQNVGRFYGYSTAVKPKAIAEAWGDIDKLFEGVDGYKTLLESGYSTLFGLAGNVAANMVKGDRND